MNSKHFADSSLIKKILIGIGSLVFLLLAFKAGEVVGYHKARFSYQWAQGYHRNFGGPRHGFFDDFSDKKDYINAHGTFGNVIKIDGDTLIISSQSNAEKVILINDKTLILRNRETIKASDIKIDDRVLVIGSGTAQGQIEAKFIRLLPNSLQ